MLTKEKLDEIIKRRHAEGKTLSIQRIKDEAYSVLQVDYHAKKHYGSWTGALRGNGVKPNINSVMSKAEVIEDLRRLQSEGHSMRSSDLPSNLYTSIVKHFGGYKNAKIQLGISVKRNPGRRACLDKEKIVNEVKEIIGDIRSKTEFSEKHRPLAWRVIKAYGSIVKFEKEAGIKFPIPERKPTKPMYTDEQLSEFIITKASKGETSTSLMRSKDAKDRSKYSASVKRWGTWGQALARHGYASERLGSDEEVAEKYLKERQSGINRNNVSHRTTIRNRFGSFDKLNELVGFVEPVKYIPELMEAFEVDAEVSYILLKEKRDITSAVLDSHNPDLSFSIREHYGTVLNYFTQRTSDFYALPRVPYEWTEESVIRHLKRWIREGEPVNYVAVSNDRRGILDASLRLFGGWDKAFESIGLDYEDYRVDTNMASAYGFKFEELVAEILTELDIRFRREPAINGCHPDYVVGDHWIDAKLSEWTIRAPDCETVKKYEPHCGKLSIYYLRGYGNGDGITKISEKTTLYPVTSLIERLPEPERKIYEDKANELLNELTEKAS